MYFDEIDNSNIISIFNVGNVREMGFDDLKSGLAKGTIFTEEYRPYKNYQVYPIKSLSEQENLLLKIYELDFAINDLNLYLDINPDSKEAFMYFKKYCEAFKKCLADYEYMYGPIELTSVNSDHYRWLEDPWPWESRRDSLYV